MTRLIQWLVVALAAWVPSCVPALAGQPRGWAVLSDGSRVDLGPCVSHARSSGAYVFSRSREPGEPPLPALVSDSAEPLTVVALEVQDGPRRYRVDARDFRATGTTYYRGLPVLLHDEVVSGGTLVPAEYARGTIRAYVHVKGPR